MRPIWGLKFFFWISHPSNSISCEATEKDEQLVLYLLDLRTWHNFWTKMKHDRAGVFSLDRGHVHWSWADLALVGIDRGRAKCTCSLGLVYILRSRGSCSFSVPKGNQSMLKDLAVLPQCLGGPDYPPDGADELLASCGRPRQFYLMPRRASLPS